jgi:hypothetical protein
MTELKKCRGSCMDCKAWNEGFKWCELHFKIENRGGAFGVSVPYPAEPCPRPMTNKALVEFSLGRSR